MHPQIVKAIEEIKAAVAVALEDNTITLREAYTIVRLAAAHLYAAIAALGTMPDEERRQLVHAAFGALWDSTLATRDWPGPDLIVKPAAKYLLTIFLDVSLDFLLDAPDSVRLVSDASYTVEDSDSLPRFERLRKRLNALRERGTLAVPVS